MEKMVAKATAAERTIFPARLKAKTLRSAQKEQTPLRYQTPFMPEIDGMEPSEKFNPPKFTMHDGKSDLRSYINHFQQMMALWNHLEALMCKVFPSSLGDLRMKWFEKRGQSGASSNYSNHSWLSLSSTLRC